MAIYKVAQLGHPVLRQVAEPVDPESIPTAAFQTFLDDLEDTMHAYEGAGLAAPQVHVSSRVVVLVLNGEAEHWINPVITVLPGPTRRTLEGCLSVEGLRGVVERPSHVRVDFLDRQGVAKTYDLSGFPAIVAQHECDHLDGVIYVDRVLPRSLVFEAELMRYGSAVGFDHSDDEPADAPEG